jgi:hypothetical protein
MERAWGLHNPAQFKDIGENRFVVRFNSEGDWKHAMHNGPWQFDFNVVLLKRYDGSTRPSDMVFDSMEIHVRVLDLPMDMMNRAYGELFGGWIGKFVSVDVDEDGMAWGEDLRIRVEIRVDQPLLRGVCVKESDDDEAGKWFDIRYEKIPHFCFECGRLVHSEVGCTAEVVEQKQWGEWLRAEPRKLKKSGQSNRPSASSGSFSHPYSAEPSFRGKGVSIRDIPPRRNISRDYSYSSSSHTGGNEFRHDGGDVSSYDNRMKLRDSDPGMDDLMCRSPQKKNSGRGGTYVRKSRATVGGGEINQVPLGTMNKKRGSKQVWLPVPVRVIGEDAAESAGKRQKTASVFDRLEDPNQKSADSARQSRRGQ